MLDKDKIDAGEIFTHPGCFDSWVFGWEVEPGCYALFRPLAHQPERFATWEGALRGLGIMASSPRWAKLETLHSL